MVADVHLVFFAPSTAGPGAARRRLRDRRVHPQDPEGAGGAVRPRCRSKSTASSAKPELARQMKIDRVPATAVIGAEDYGVRYYGMPGGYEFVTLLELVLDVSKMPPPLAPATLEALSRAARGCPPAGLCHPDLTALSRGRPGWPPTSRSLRRACAPTSSRRVNFPTLRGASTSTPCQKPSSTTPQEVVGAVPERLVQPLWRPSPRRP